MKAALVVLCITFLGFTNAFAQEKHFLQGPFVSEVYKVAHYSPTPPSLLKSFSQPGEEGWKEKYVLGIQDVEVRLSVSRHLHFKDAHEYNAFHPELRLNFKGGLSAGAYRNSNYYWSPYISFRLYDFTRSTNVNLMVAWYGDKSVPVLVWKTEVFRRVELFAITHPLLETSKVVAGVSFVQRF